MFVGLFIVVAGLEKGALTPPLLAASGRLHLESVPVLSAVTAVLSNLASNVPALLGSVANLIVVQGAQARGVRIGFWKYFKIGAPLTVLTIAVGILCL